MSSLRIGVFAHLTSLQKLYIAGNPWRCDCSLHYILTSTILSDKIDELFGPTCNSPPHMKGDALKGITSENICQSRGDCTTESADGSCACNIGWTGTYCEKEDNLAIGKKASQSSTAGNGTGAEKAVDGSNTDCARTDYEYQPWWKVDLAGYFTVNRVTIEVPLLLWGEIRNTLTVRVGPNENFTQNALCGQNYTTEPLNTQIIMTSCDPPMYGRYVSVQATPPGDVNTTDLSLCEVKVHVTGACCNNTISIMNGQITASNGYCSGNSIDFSCDTGYKLVGSSFVVCRDMHWNPGIPTCQRICCDNATEIINGLVNATDGYCFGNEIQFSCNPGYELVGRSLATCEDDGSWGRELPTCRPYTVTAAIVISCLAGIFLVLFLAVGIIWDRVKKRREEDIAGTTEESHLYDVFISYSSKDSPWVTDLQKDLEKNHYTTCLHQRDFQVGETVVTNIANSIYQCRKVLLVMSKNFIESGWCKYELDLAYQRKNDRNDNCVIVVKYDDCEIPRELAGITYLDWTNQTSKETFWTRLQKSLGPVSVSDEACAVSENREREEML